MSKQLRELQARKSTLVKEARALTDRAASDNRDLSDEEVTAFDALKSRIEAASNAIDREASLIAEEAQMAHAPASSGAFITVTDNREADPLHGFRTAGEFSEETNPLIRLSGIEDVQVMGVARQQSRSALASDGPAPKIFVLLDIFSRA
jgi:HK97 family phage major capsid protein